MITTPLLFQMAKACAVAEEPHLTLATMDHGARYAAWSYGAVRLPRDVLADVEDGTWRIYANGRTKPYEVRGYTPAWVRRMVVPVLDAGDRVSVEATSWLCEVSHAVTNRILERRGDGEAVVVNQKLWAPWSQALRIPVWQSGRAHGPLLWAADKDTRAEALLMPIRKSDDVVIPAAFRDAVAAVSEVTA